MLDEQQGATGLWVAFPYCCKKLWSTQQGLIRDMLVLCAHQPHLGDWLLIHFHVHVQAAVLNIILVQQVSSRTASLLSMHGSCSELPAAAVSQRCLACGPVCADLLETDSVAC